MYFEECSAIFDSVTVCVREPHPALQISVDLMLSTACRPSELFQISKSTMNLSSGDWYYLQNKTKSYRHVVLDPVVLTSYRYFRTLYNNLRNYYYTIDSLRREFNSCFLPVRYLGFENNKLYLCRYISVASLLLNGHTKIFISKWLGHTDSVSVDTYIKHAKIILAHYTKRS